jgi:hypothetical protein
VAQYSYLGDIVRNSVLKQPLPLFCRRDKRRQNEGEAAAIFGPAGCASLPLLCGGIFF